MKDSAWIAFVGALLFIVVGVAIIVMDYTKSMRCTMETVAEVIDWVERKERNTDEDSIEEYTYTYYPVYKYEAGDRIIEKQSNTGYASKFSSMKEETIYYNPDNPEEFVISNEYGFFDLIFPGLFIIAGILLFVGGINSLKLEEQ